MNLVNGTLSLIFFAFFVGGSSSRKDDHKKEEKKRDKPRSMSLGSERIRQDKPSRRSISVVDVEFEPCSPKPISMEREESGSSLCEMKDPLSHIRPNVGTFDTLKTRYHVMAPLNPGNVKLGDYTELFPDSPSPVTLSKKKKHKHKKDKKSRPASPDTSSSSTSSSSSDSDSDSGRKSSRHRHRGGSLGSNPDKSKKKDKKK